MTRARSTAGFTILEVLIAMAILCFGMVCVLGLLTYGTATARSAQLRTSAAAAAQAVVADLEESLFPDEDGEAGAPRPVVERRLEDAADVVYSATAEANPERPAEYKVDVSMTWSSQGVRREMRFTTLLLREVPFGERLRRRFVRQGAAAATSAAGAAPPSATTTTTPATTTSATSPTSDASAPSAAGRPR